MNKVLKVLFVIAAGVIGTCSLIWLLGTTAGSAQEAQSRGEAFGIFIGITVFGLIGMAIYRLIKRKSN